MTEFLTRDAILSVNDIATEVVDVPAWGGKVRVRGLTGEERDRFEESMLEGKGKNRQVRLANFRAKLVSLCIVDDKGNRLFSEGDVAALGKKSAAGLGAVCDVAQRLAGLSEEDVEELTANLSSAPGAGSSSSSPES